MKLIEKAWHTLRMWFSREYARNYNFNAVLVALGEEILSHEHHPVDISVARDLVAKGRHIAPQHIGELVTMLAEGNNFAYKALAIELDPNYGRICADQLMTVARQHLTLSGHADRAMWARRRLILARNWYAISGVLTATREAEINRGIEATDWVCRA